MDASKRALIEVVFVGGPLHGTRTLMAQPDLRIEVGADPDTTDYCRRMVEMRDIGGAPMQVATYAPYGMPEHEFTRLVIDIARQPRVST